MAYDLPTPATLRVLFPEFTSVPDETVEAYITVASRSVDTSWFEGDYTTAITYLACHLMALSGIGSGPDSVGNNSNMSIYQQVRSGQLSLTRAAKVGTPSSDPWQFQSTRYGRLFWPLLLVNRGGPRVAGGLGWPHSGYAKDWPTVFGRGLFW